MFSLYLFSFILGGFFVSLSILGGIDGADFEGDFDLDGDIGELEFDPELETDIEVSTYGNEEDPSRLIPRPQPPLWLILLKSFKFWTFGGCFFGLTGLVLSWLTPELAVAVIFTIALGVGLTCGMSLVSVLRSLRQNQANSLIKNDELVGALGVVEIPFDRDSRGKVRLQIKDGTFDCMALTEEEQGFRRGDPILVVGKENNKVWVVSQKVLEKDADFE